MDISAQLDGAINLITLTGSLDALSTGQVTSFLSGQVANGQPRLLLDLSGVEFMSSAGLRALLAGMKEARQQGGDLRLAGPRPGIEKVLKLSGFTSILKCYASVPEALAEYAAPL